MNIETGKVFTCFKTGKVPLQILILQRIESVSVQQVGEVSRPLYCRPEYYRKYHRIKKVGCCEHVTSYWIILSGDSGQTRHYTTRRELSDETRVRIKLGRGNGHQLSNTMPYYAMPSSQNCDPTNITTASCCKRYLPITRILLTKVFQSFHKTLSGLIASWSTHPLIIILFIQVLMMYRAK